MATHASIEAIVAVQPAPGQGCDAYTNTNAFTTKEGVRSVFGGALIGQAVSAATATVPKHFQMYSSQSSFLGPVDTGKEVIYRVERTSDRNTYITRIVRVTQGDECAFVAVISFQNAAKPVLNALQYEIPMPDLDGTRPEDIDPGMMFRLQGQVINKSVPVLALSPEQWPFDWRPFSMEMGDQPTDIRIRIFVRAPPLSSENHLAAFSYLSDEFVFGTAIATDLKAFARLKMGVTLTNTISIHSPQARIDKWIVLERETTWGAHGRVIIHQRAWDMETGKLVYSGTQEALIRLKAPKL